jgi:DNA-directed RNA polymerase specialized sigma24 family protein
MDDALLEALEGQHRSWDRAWEEDSSEAILALRQCIDRLQVTARRIVDLFYFKKRSCAEVAGRVKATEDAVKKRLERIRGHLGDCIQERMKAGPSGREL